MSKSLTPEQVLAHAASLLDPDDRNPAEPGEYVRALAEVCCLVFDVSVADHANSMIEMLFAVAGVQAAAADLNVPGLMSSGIA